MSYRTPMWLPVSDHTLTALKLLRSNGGVFWSPFRKTMFIFTGTEDLSSLCRYRVHTTFGWLAIEPAPNRQFRIWKSSNSIMRQTSYIKLVARKILNLILGQFMVQKLLYLVKYIVWSYLYNIPKWNLYWDKQTNYGTVVLTPLYYLRVLTVLAEHSVGQRIAIKPY